MNTPFTTAQFFDVFVKYNSTIFPGQLILIVLGVVMMFLLHSGSSLKNAITGVYLGFLWLWLGIVYQIVFFTAINKAAFVFGGFFIVEGMLILYHTLGSKRLSFEFQPRIRDYLGYFFILFGLIIYPVIGYLSVGSLVKTITLGLPCPTTILTFGFFLLTSRKFPGYLLIIPSLWAIIGLSAAVNFGVYQDFMLLVAAIVANVFLIKSRRNKKD